MDFESFWKEYPRKIAKDTAYKKWISIKPNIDTVLKSLKNQKKTDQWSNIKYIPHPTTWLNQKRWNDEVIDDRKIDIINQVTKPDFSFRENIKPEKEITKEEQLEIEREKKKIRQFVKQMKRI